MRLQAAYPQHRWTMRGYKIICGQCECPSINPSQPCGDPVVEIKEEEPSDV